MRLIRICRQCHKERTRHGPCHNCRSLDPPITTLPKPVTVGMVHANQELAFSRAQNVPVPTRVRDVKERELPRVSTGFENFDRVLGGGAVLGSTIIFCGEPGIGKTTLLVQTLGNQEKESAGLYVTGEQTVAHVAAGAHRFGKLCQDVEVIHETNVDMVLVVLRRGKYRFGIIDSLPTMVDPLTRGRPGGKLQMEACSKKLDTFAKKTSMILFMICHVTKEGGIAGPKSVEHYADVVLEFGGVKTEAYRTVHAYKNRFGATTEVAAFDMTGKGLVARKVRETKKPVAAKKTKAKAKKTVAKKTTKKRKGR